MDFLEKDLETIIFETPNKILRFKGLYFEGQKLRQVRIGNYGVCDMISIKQNVKTKKIIISVFEMKLNKITENTFFQAIRYVKGIQEFIKFKYGVEVLNKVIFNIYLIGNGIDINNNSNVSYLRDIFPNIHICKYIYSIDGLIFIMTDSYSLIDSGFKQKK